jgi:hypothetical protein
MVRWQNNLGVHRSSLDSPIYIYIYIYIQFNSIDYDLSFDSSSAHGNVRKVVVCTAVVIFRLCICALFLKGNLLTWMDVIGKHASWK